MTRRAILEMPGMRFELLHRGDRFGHRIWTVDARRDVLLLTSQEGTPDDPWPPSPPLQELHLESRPGGKELALLVGMAGHSHWSLSAELDAAAGTLTLDVACRVRDRAGPLGSRYATDRLWQAQLECGAFGSVVDDREYRLEVDRATEPCAELVIPAPRQIAVLPVIGPESKASPRTIRWRYVVRQVRR